MLHNYKQSMKVMIHTVLSFVSCLVMQVLKYQWRMGVNQFHEAAQKLHKTNNKTRALIQNKDVTWPE